MNQLQRVWALLGAIYFFVSTLSNNKFGSDANLLFFKGEKSVATFYRENF